MSVDYTKLIRAIVPGDDGEGDAHLRKGVVEAVNGDGTADVLLAGVTVADVPILAGAVLEVDANVQILVQRGGLLILGMVGDGVDPVVPYAYATFGTPTLTTGILTTLTPAAVPVNDGNMWTSGTNFTIPTGQGGLYEIGIALQYASQVTSAGQRQARFQVNGGGGSYTATTAVGLNGTLTQGNFIAQQLFDAGDVITYHGLQSSGGNLALVAASHGWLRQMRKS